MVKLSLLLTLYVVVVVVVVATAVPVLSGNVEGPEDVEKWSRELGQYKEKITKLHFYFHDLRGKTSVIVAQQANSSPKSPIYFGMTSIMDDPLTAGPEFTSKPVGRAQGLFASSALKEPSTLLCIINFVFTDDKYNGSTFTVAGYNPTLRKHRELPIIGGTGVFRLARGVAQLKYVYFDVAGGNATVEYNVIVQHY